MMEPFRTMLKHFVSRTNSNLIFSRSFSSTLYVKGISFSSTKETLTEAFSRCGQVVRVDVIMNKKNCRPKGFAYVTFSSEDEAQRALAEMNGQLVDGRIVILDSNKRPAKGDSTKPNPKPEGDS